MKRASIFIFLLFCFTWSFSETISGRRSRILAERFEREKGEITLDLRVSLQEKQYLENSYINTLIKMKKVEYLIKSSQFLKENCVPFDSRCRNVYNMSIAYLTDEKKTVEVELEEQTRIVSESKERIDALKERLAYIEKGVDIEDRKRTTSSVIPELARSLKCSNLRGWNYYRGIFTDPSGIKDIGKKMSVKDVVQLSTGEKMMILEAGNYTLNFTYIGEALLKKGEVTEKGKPFFKGSAGNPVMPGKNLVFIRKNNVFVNPRFMCR